MHVFLDTENGSYEIDGRTCVAILNVDGQVQEGSTGTNGLVLGMVRAGGLHGEEKDCIPLERVSPAGMHSGEHCLLLSLPDGARMETAPIIGRREPSSQSVHPIRVAATLLSVVQSPSDALADIETTEPPILPPSSPRAS